MVARRNIVVLPHQQIQNVDVIIPRLRSVHKEPRPRPLAQRIIHVLRIVRKHSKRAIPAHNRIGPRKTLHQHSRNLQLPRA